MTKAIIDTPAAASVQSEASSRPHQPTISTMDNDDVVVDYGLIWFRVNADGEIIRKTATTHGVKISPATPAEIHKVRAALAAGAK